MSDTYRALACAVLEDAVKKLRATHGPKEIAFFRTPKLCAVWCEAAGFDYDALVSKLAHQGLLVPAPVVAKGPKPPKQTMPTRTKAYQMALRRKMLKRLPNSPDTGCSTRELAQAVSVYFKAAQNVLASLKRDQLADTRTEARRGGLTAIWWRV